MHLVCVCVLLTPARSRVGVGAGVCAAAAVQQAAGVVCGAHAVLVCVRAC
jgi:hypothetical protein